MADYKIDYDAIDNRNMALRVDEEGRVFLSKEDIARIEKIEGDIFDIKEMLSELLRKSA